jgi:hypothetical protein
MMFIFSLNFDNSALKKYTISANVNHTHIHYSFILSMEEKLEKRIFYSIFFFGCVMRKENNKNFKS